MKKRNEKPYFESWYFREQAEDCTCEFIVTIDYDKEGKMTGHLDVRVPDRVKHYDFSHPVNMNLKDSIFLVLDKNVFTEACLHLNMDEPDLSVKGDIWFEREFGNGRIGFRRKIWAMEQQLSGELVINGRVISFDGGKGYLESQRGVASEWPRRRFWTQCNWFEEKSFRIVCGGYGRHCFAWINQDGYPMRLTRWRGAKVEYMCGGSFRMSQGGYVLEGWRCTEVDLSCPDQTVRYRLSHGHDVLFDEISPRAMYRYEGEGGTFSGKDV